MIQNNNNTHNTNKNNANNTNNNTKYKTIKYKTNSIPNLPILYEYASQKCKCFCPILNSSSYGFYTDINMQIYLYIYIQLCLIDLLDKQTFDLYFGIVFKHDAIYKSLCEQNILSSVG